MCLIAFGITCLNTNARRLGMPGLAGSKMVSCIEAAENTKFDVLLTVDRGIVYQQDFGNRKIAMVILCAKSIALNHLTLLVPALLDQLQLIRPGQVIRIGDE